MSIRLRPPETITIEISRGDWIRIKKHLTAGEQLDMFERMRRETADGSVAVDGIKVGINRLTTYLLDWSFQDPQGQLIPIAGKSQEEIATVVRLLPPEDFTELITVITAHEEAMAKARDLEKNDPATASASTAPSPSVAP